MQALLERLRRLATELKRRRVHRVAGLYAVTLFVALQIADVTLEPLGLPVWWLAVLVVVGMAGFPVALVLAWAFDVTDDGLRQTTPGPIADVLGRSPLTRSATVLGTAAVSVGLGWGAWQVWLGSADHVRGGEERGGHRVYTAPPGGCQ